MKKRSEFLKALDRARIDHWHRNIFSHRTDKEDILVGTHEGEENPIVRAVHHLDKLLVTPPHRLDVSDLAIIEEAWEYYQEHAPQTVPA